MELSINDKVAIVCASSEGLGFSCAKALLTEGAKVVINGRSKEKLENAKTLLSEIGEVSGVLGDIAQKEIQRKLVDYALKQYDKIDILVTNVGGPKPAKAIELGEQEYLDSYTSIFLSAINLFNLVKDGFIAQGFGRLVVLASYSSVEVIDNLALSNVNRAALWAWVKSLSHDLMRISDNITANVVCPGPHKTKRMEQLSGKGRMGNPDDLGSLVAYICSDKANFVNGTRFVVDGGQTSALMF